VAARAVGPTYDLAVRLKLVVVLAFTGFLASAVAADSRAATMFFRTPGNNVWCAYDEGARGAAKRVPTLRCDVRGGVKPLPPKPRTCLFDWGVGMSMSTRGGAKILCASDTVYSERARVLEYGWTFVRGGFTCVARRVALRCRNADGHGFSLSRTRSYRF
jgi:hypothetical protein